MKNSHQIFTLTEQHVKLLQRMYISWWGAEFGAPGVDPKRPYGNSYVEGDIAEILEIVGEEEDEDYDDPQLSEDQKAECLRIHLETEKALQVVLATKSFEPGVYVASLYNNDWQRLK